MVRVSGQSRTWRRSVQLHLRHGQSTRDISKRKTEQNI